MKSAYFDATKVRQAAQGNWLAILATLAPHLDKALQRPGRHAGCPVHGGRDGFRLFKDVDLTGGGICATCGPKGDGISMLMWLCNWEYQEALSHIALLMGVEPEQSRRQVGRITSAVQPAVKSPIGRGALKSTHAGNVLKWGHSHYKHNAANNKSFFLELQDNDGFVEVLWGWGLKPLVKGLEKGQSVKVSKYARNDGKGNSWDVEQLNAATPHVEPTPAEPAEAAPSFDQAKVMSLYKDKPWLKEVQAEMQRRLAAEAEYSARLEARIGGVWEQCLSLEDPSAAPCRQYLNSRALTGRYISQDAVRFHPAMPYFDEDGNKVGDFPCMVAAIRDLDGNLVTLHRTYLSATGGKAKVPGGGSIKKMMSIPQGKDVKGCAIQLMPATGGVLGLAEGMETALSAHRATGIPTWAAVSAVLLECAQIPEGVHTVVIWADKDRSRTGELTANALAVKLTAIGIKVHIMLPVTAIAALSKSVDWNDVLVKEGVMGFPEPRYIRAIRAQGV